MLSLSDNNPAGLIEELNSSSRYPDDLLNIDDTIVQTNGGQIYPTELS